MIGCRPGIGLHLGHPDQWRAEGRSRTGQPSENPAAGDFHGSIGLKKRISARGKPIAQIHENAIVQGLSLTF
jgi:hypothetical protein